MSADARVLVLDDEERFHKSRSFWMDAVRHFRRDRLSMLSLAVLLLLTLACFFGPPIVEKVLHVDVSRTDLIHRNLPPGEGGLLGTDQLGRDHLIRLLYGGQVSLAVAYLASLVSITIGVVVGIVTAYYGGVVDDAVMWFINTLESVPTIFLLLIAATIWSPSAQVLILILGALGWVTTCRLVRGQVLSLKANEFMLAARAIGARDWWMMLSHIFPNTISLVVISLTINAGSLILVESGLSYLGLGVQPPTPTWGNMLTEARSYFVQGTHLVIWPGLLISLTVLCFYLVGDGLRDALDPRSVRGR